MVNRSISPGIHAAVLDRQDLRQSLVLLNRNGTQPVDSRSKEGASVPVYISKTHFAEDPGYGYLFSLTTRRILIFPK